MNAESPHNIRRPFITIKIPKKTIKVPIIVCKSLNFFSLIYEDPSPSANKTGAVPRAKIAIAKPPSKKFPVLIATSCMESVKPQGKKKVNAHTRGAKIGFLVVNVFSDRLFGK